MLIGELAKKSGFTRDTIRYYEELGLIHPEARRESNYREFGQKTLSVLKFIAKAKRLGFSLAEIKKMKTAFLSQIYSCNSASAFINTKLTKIDDEIARLQKHRRGLNELIAFCLENPQSGQCISFEKLWDDEVGYK